MNTVPRSQYLNARRMLRDNGRYSLRWMSAEAAQIMSDLLNAPEDILAERAQILRDFGRSGAQLDVRYRSAQRQRSVNP